MALMRATTAGGVLCVLLVLAIGCSQQDPRIPKGQKKAYPVKGQVLVKGQPAAGAMVVFHPVDEAANRDQLRPHANTDADGRFVMNTYLPGDGAPAGEWVVTVLWEQKQGPSDDDEKAEAGPDQLGGRYSDKKKSPLKVTVKEGPNELEPFRLD